MYLKTCLPGCIVFTTRTTKKKKCTREYVRVCTYNMLCHKTNLKNKDSEEEKIEWRNLKMRLPKRNVEKNVHHTLMKKKAGWSACSFLHGTNNMMICHSLPGNEHPPCHVVHGQKNTEIHAKWRSTENDTFYTWALNMLWEPGRMSMGTLFLER